MLSLQKYLREHGLEKTVSDLKIIAKQKDELVLFKYNQIESDFSLESVQEARGIILDSSDNWNIVNYTFKKFFNIQEYLASKIDWNTSQVLMKHDGSLINIWNHKGIWRMSTSGVIDADTYANDGLIKYSDLVIRSISKRYNMNFDKFCSYLNPLYCYAFELCTPFNIVITQHKEYNLILLGIRNKITLEEQSIFDSNLSHLEKPKQYALRDQNEISKTFENMTFEEEGYVVVDKDYNRVKIKNPSYVSVHFLKGSLGAHYIMQVIKDNELSEFCTYFKERSDEAYYLKNKYDEFISTLNDIFKLKLNSGIGFENQKEYAIAVQTKVDREYHGLMYALKAGKFTDAKEWVVIQDNKYLYIKFDYAGKYSSI